MSSGEEFDVLLQPDEPPSNDAEAVVFVYQHGEIRDMSGRRITFQSIKPVLFFGLADESQYGYPCSAVYTVCKGRNGAYFALAPLAELTAAQTQ
mmetsp:Transcript_15136/g.24916  ORF Transcript_15136/g.24916 Transcript_15136/m.24916 type:complete len:94 (+) Transcript_15136:222-503(+)